MINGEPHTVIARYFETSEYGAMTELKTEGHLLCLDKDLQPFMGFCDSLACGALPLRPPSSCMHTRHNQLFRSPQIFQKQDNNHKDHCPKSANAGQNVSNFAPSF
ncbi:hypothetical protein B0I18_106210 [Taibaiella chishuiensis]|uniref:Uncharacterized protein n=1 Tax=Taibaiella chishuiensis TaxID=1434707 RepID=A0A2P8D1V2_9BACT|nr:hypothetical protein B0I18_106210 [Taibaiella chishuiensis]